MSGGKGCGERILREAHRHRPIMAAVSRAAAIGTVTLLIDLAVAGGVAFPEAFGFLAQPILRPGRGNAGRVVGGDFLPRLFPRHVAFAGTADPVTDHARQCVEPRSAIHAALADLPAEQLGHAAALGGGHVEVEPVLAFEGRHRDDCLDQLAKVAIARIVVQDLHQPPKTLFGVDRSRHADRLVRGPERRVAANLRGDHVPGATDRGDVVAFGGLGQTPVEVQLVLAFGGDTTRRDLQSRAPARPCSNSTRFGTNSSPPNRHASWHCWSTVST